uniref:RIIa domain-containing protein n=1 Tax=Glossina palpalis gambiensis TaxID=67801 RepID=A0A1B0AZN0_9MUSC
MALGNPRLRNKNIAFCAYVCLSPSDAMPNENKRIQVPDELREVLLEFSISFLLEQPADVVDFAVDYFTKLQADRKLAAGTQEGNGEEAKGGDSLEEEEDDEANKENDGGRIIG